MLEDAKMSKSFGFKLSALLFVVAAGGCLSGSALADQTHVNYSVAAGGKSPLIAVPISNSPVLMSCVQNVRNNVGEGQATIVQSTTDGLLDWVGFDYFKGAISRGFSAVNGTHMIFCDFAGEVDIEVGSATQIQVANHSTATMTGVIMFNY
jgi:hypothetical protein